MKNKDEKEIKTEKKSIPKKTELELKQIALDINKGLIYTDRHIPKSELEHGALGSVFIPLLFIDQDTRDTLKDVGMIYEYLSEAGPRSCNGMPGFFSFHFLDKEDTLKVLTLVKELADKDKEFLESDDKKKAQAEETKLDAKADAEERDAKSGR